MAITSLSELQSGLLFGAEYVWVRLQEALEGIDDEQMKWRPYGGHNSLGAILLHMGRMDDSRGSRRFLQVPQLWDKDGDDWKGKLNFPDPLPDKPFEMGWTFDSIAPAENKITMAQLTEYFLASQERMKKAILETTQEFLDIAVDDGNPHHAGWTNASWLLHGPLHLSHHQAQVDYVSGLIKAGRAE